MYVSRNVEARSSNHYNNWKAKTITYSENVFVALSIQHAMRMSHIVICGLPTTAEIFHFIS
jgi:BarA-like signal transduction histidine kinase